MNSAPPAFIQAPDSPRPGAAARHSAPAAERGGSDSGGDATAAPLFRRREVRGTAEAPAKTTGARRVCEGALSRARRARGQARPCGGGTPR
jgi:hypothetical protein